jgi:hypothetical protein
MACILQISKVAGLAATTADLIELPQECLLFYNNYFFYNWVVIHVSHS